MQPCASSLISIPMQEVAPQRIGRYDIICPMGEGGMARAYLVVNRGPGGFNKLSVVKQILPDLASDANFVAMLLDEARLAARLHHPNIVQTFDVAEHDGSYALAMEYLDGISLSTVQRRIHPTEFPVETHLWILTQVLAGLHYAHTLCDYDGTPLGVVHRDVNPSNVLVTYTGEVKLLDFGVAKARGALATGTEKCIMGKPGYCAPEQLRKVEIDARADVFAVGVMLWEALAGKRLNRSKSLQEAAKTRLSGNELKIRAVRPDTPSALADICDRALAMDPDDRFASAADFGDALLAQLGSLGGQGRQFLVTRLKQEFMADRQALRQTIEQHLKVTFSERTAGPTLNTMVRELPSPPPVQGFVTPPLPPLASRRFTRMPALFGVAIVLFGASALLVFLFATRLTGESIPPTLTRSPFSAAPTSFRREPSETPETPATPTARTGKDLVTPSSRTTQTQGRAKRNHPSSASLSRNRVIPREAPETAAVSAAAPSEGTKRRNVPAEGAATTVEPGTHILRPTSKPILNTVDDKDPYSP